MQYDLEERTALFAEKTIFLLKTLPNNSINKRLIEQLVASSGSVGANYCEANEAESRRDFIHKLRISKKEIKESKHWIRLLTKANEKQKDKFEILWRGAHELLLIFAKIISSTLKSS